jgi:hypothetical protein
MNKAASCFFINDWFQSLIGFRMMNVATASMPQNFWEGGLVVLTAQKVSLL